MLHEARQTFIHVEAKKLRDKLDIDMTTAASFLIVKEILDRYDNHSKEPSAGGRPNMHIVDELTEAFAGATPEQVKKIWEEVIPKRISSLIPTIVAGTSGIPFNINRDEFYEHGKSKDRTRERLTQIAQCGMSVVSEGQFGYPGVMSGLYIERVWSLSDEAFKDYMDWAIGLISEFKAKQDGTK